ncbi:MAG: hypothetical protein WCF84_03685 [Anaerolineae bacterium]
MFNATTQSTFTRLLGITLFALLVLGLATSTVTAAAPTGGGTLYQETDAAVAYNGWIGQTDTLASGGTLRYGIHANDIAKFTFTGASIMWRTRYFSMGAKVLVTIDGVSKGTIDTYAATGVNASKTFAGLTNAKHTIAIKNTGLVNPSCGCPYGYAGLDAFVVNGITTYEDTDYRIKYDTWTSGTNLNADGPVSRYGSAGSAPLIDTAAAPNGGGGGNYRYSSSSAANAVFGFVATNVNWVTATGPNFGKARVWLDGVDKGIVDLYTPTPHWQVIQPFSAATTGYHTLKIQVLGQKNAASTGAKIVVDSFVTF